MKTKKQIIMAILGLTFLVSCQKEVQTDEEFTIQHKASALVDLGSDEMSIEFADLVEDSRCPENATCIMQGQVAVLLRINNEFQVVIGNGDYPTQMTFEDKTITLLDVGYGKAKNQGDSKHYEIRLKVN